MSFTSTLGSLGVGDRVGGGRGRGVGDWGVDRRLNILDDDCHGKYGVSTFLLRQKQNDNDLLMPQTELLAMSTTLIGEGLMVAQNIMFRFIKNFTEDHFDYMVMLEGGIICGISSTFWDELISCMLKYFYIFPCLSLD